MSDTVKVYWTTRAVDLMATWENLAYFEPELALKRLSLQREKPALFLKCPATQDYFKNTYAILSPLDFRVRVVRHPNGTKYISTDRYGQEFFDKYINDKNPDHKTFSTFVLGFDYQFYSEESVIVELIPAQMDAEYKLHNIRLIQGQFDISKWIRPVEFSCEIIDDATPVEFTRGSPLFYVKFKTENNNSKKVELIRTEVNDSLSKVAGACLRLKKYIPGLSLEENYKLAEPYIKIHKDKLFPKKCPFSKFWKK